MQFTKLAPGVPTDNGVTIQPRRFEFKGYDEVPRLWVGDHVWLTQFFNALSILIPEAERFMIKAIRRATDHIDDELLKNECKVFVIQEAHHQKIHDKLNQVLIEQGYSIEKDIKATNSLFNVLGKLPLRFQLGIASALEHLTAIVSSVGLEEMDTFYQISHPKMCDLWQWHGAEELEHKTVVFNLFRKLGGGYFLRVVSALMTLIICGLFLFTIHVRLIRQYRKLEGEESLRNQRKVETEKLSICNKMLKRLGKKFVSLLLTYLKPRFHPLDIEDTEILDRWYARNDTLEKGEASRTQVIQITG